MTESGPTVLHVAASREDRGGIQSTLLHHHAADAAMGFAPAFVSVFDPQSTWSGDCATLAGWGGLSIGALRKRFATLAGRYSRTLAIYHDGWGIEGFAPLDGAGRRLVYLHTERDNADELLRIFDRRVDGFIAVSRAFGDRVRRVLPGFPEERICEPPFFVESPGWIAAGPRPLGRPLRLGYAGRIERGHKRLDRLPALLAELDRCGLEYRFELLGEGGYQADLQRRLQGHPRVVFSGWRGGEDYWRTIRDWDVLVLLSDCEGFSRVTMECMCAGVLPVHPDFSAAAAELLGPLALHGLYPTGNVVAAARRVIDLVKLAPAMLDGLRARGAEHLGRHTPGQYGRIYFDFARRIAALPRRSTSPSLARWVDVLPVGVCTRLFPCHF